MPRYFMLIGIILFISASQVWADHAIKPSVIGGVQVENPKIYGAMVEVQTEHGMCTGSYVGNNKIITAAHCNSEDKIKKVIFVQLQPPAMHIYRYCNVDEIVANPAFKDTETTVHEDIAVLKISCPDLNLSRIPKFEIADGTVPITAGNLNIAGYGVHDNLGARPSHPYLFALLPPATMKKTGIDRLDQAIASNQIVCFPSSSLETFYIGDSGGPGFYVDHSGKFTLGAVGSVVLVQNDAPIGYCHVQIPRFKSWIESVAN